MADVASDSFTYLNARAFIREEDLHREVRNERMNKKRRERKANTGFEDGGVCGMQPKQECDTHFRDLCHSAPTSADFTASSEGSEEAAARCCQLKHCGSAKNVGSR